MLDGNDQPFTDRNAALRKLLKRAHRLGAQQQ
jgi:hypothetical protein